jgi:hypothetical protein
MDIPELLARAAHYETRQGLLELAEQYEALAREKQQEEPE